VSEAVAERVLPTGTVTFLFSDIAGSTERWERHRDGMKAAVAKHDALMREAIAANGGFVFKTIGDAFCAAFQTAPDAIAAALSAQRALGLEDWSGVDGLKVRMAVHTGLADERDGDYFGPTVNRVARLLSIGHGGQVLVSGVSTELSQGAMPAKSTLRDLGAHRLRDLTHPEQVYQLVASGLPADFPPLLSLDALPNNLPLQLTHLVGREDDLAEVEDLLAKHRLVTLVGAGGVGKTRLSLQVAAELLDKFEDGVWFVDLAPLAEAALIPTTTAGLFGVSETGDRSITDSLVHALKPRKLLIVLDNCEHLVEGAARLADTLLRGCAHLRILASSREGLGIEGEVVLRVPSLAVPSTDEKLGAIEAKRYGAIALFVERASAADRRFVLTDENAGAVARICEQLDGIALAIELAATRVKVLSVEQLANRLADRFRILTAGNRTALPRQQTMRALIDWSYDLLTDEEKTLFRRLSVFAGGWTIDAASAVCADLKIDALDILELLSALVDKSMVVSELAGAAQRYRLLASTRQYASELLEQSGEAEIVRRRHAEFFLDEALKATATWNTTPTGAWITGLLPEADNYRAVLDWSLIEKRDAELGAKLTAALTRFWDTVGQNAEGRQRVTAALRAIDDRARPDLEAPLQEGLARLELTAARWHLGQTAAERAYELYQTLNDRTGVAQALSALGESFIRQRRADDAEKAFDNALSLFREIGDTRMIGYVTAQKARNGAFSGNEQRALTLYTEALPLLRASGAELYVSMVEINLGEIEFAAGNAERALVRERDLVTTLPSWDHADRWVVNLNISGYLIALDRFEEALGTAREALRYSRQLGPANFAMSIQRFAAIAAARGDLQLGARLSGFCTQSYADSGTRLDFTEQREHDNLVAILEQGLGTQELARLSAEGAAVPEDQAYDFAMKL